MKRESPVEPSVLALGPVPDHLSFSQVNVLGSCPRRWAYDKLMGLPWQGGTGMFCGKVVDRGAEVFFQARMAGKEPAEAAVLAQTAAALQAGELEWPRDGEAYTRIALEGLMTFIDAHVATIPATVQEPHRFTVRAEDGELITVVGYSDWVEAGGIINELKWSGSARWDKDGNWDQHWLSSKRDQLLTYYIARKAAQARTLRVAEQQGTALPPMVPVVPWGRVVVVHHTLRAKSPQVRTADISLDEAEVARVVAQIRDADRVARSGIHPPAPGEHCRYCDFAKRCASDLARTARPTEELVG